MTKGLELSPSSPSLDLNKWDISMLVTAAHSCFDNKKVHLRSVIRSNLYRSHAKMIHLEAAVMLATHFFFNIQGTVNLILSLKN